MFLALVLPMELELIATFTLLTCTVDITAVLETFMTGCTLIQPVLVLKEALRAELLRNRRSQLSITSVLNLGLLILVEERFAFDAVHHRLPQVVVPQHI